MPKQALKIGTFHNGLNSRVDPRDIKDDELASVSNISVDDVGRLTMFGSSVDITGENSDEPDVSTLADGYGLFRFASDRAANGNEARQDYLIVWNDSDGKFYWMPSVPGGGSDNWYTHDWLDLTSIWGASEDAVPIYYYVDGALRISDSNFANTANYNVWVGSVNRILFTDSTNTTTYDDWEIEKGELETPSNGKVSDILPTAIGDLPTNAVYWHVRNMREETTQLWDFPTTGLYPNDENVTKAQASTDVDDGDVWELTEAYYGGSDESWQTVTADVDGPFGESYHRFGFDFHLEDDSSSPEWWWTSKNASRFNDSGTIKFKKGDSCYLAVRLPTKSEIEAWMGARHIPLSGTNSLDISYKALYIYLSDGTGGGATSGSNTKWISWSVDTTQFTSPTTPPGHWHIIELPFDDFYGRDSNLTDTTTDFAPARIMFKIELNWELVGNTNIIITGNEGGVAFIEVGDLRVGESELVGIETTGKQKFSMSNTFDEGEAESLLYKFDTHGREVNLSNSTSAYQIGITAYIKDPTSTWNTRITGANLYLEDDGIPYRIAELRYTGEGGSGLRGAWEQEYPSSDRFSTLTLSSANDANKSNTVKTDGLALLESYSAMNGFSPQVSTITSKYKSAVILNRQVYVGNIYQDGKTYGDRMIKTTTNSFDCFPTRGREIDVVENDGDEIIHLATYADRILQFKRNVMYLVNATRAAEYLEDSFVGKGVEYPQAVCKTDIGIAWANENGCYLYDGEKVNDISSGLIKETEWQTHINANTDVFYLPIKKKILVTGGTNGVDVYEFSLVTNSWSKGTSKIDTVKTNTVLDVDNRVKYVSRVSGTTYVKEWDDTSSTSTDVTILTKDYDLGNPATRKKCFKFYVTYKSDGASHVKVYHGTNGLDLTGAANGTEVATSKFAGTNTDGYTNGSGLVTTGGEWKQVELKPVLSLNNIYSVQLKFKSAGTVPTSFEINDLTIVYREKPLK